MAETIRLNKVLRELNISLDRAVEFLDSKGVEVEKRPTTKISEETYSILSNEFQTDANKKMASQEVNEAKNKEKEELRVKREKEQEAKQKADDAAKAAKAAQLKKDEEVIKASKALEGPKTVGKIDLDSGKKVAKKVEKTPEAKPAVAKSEKAPEAKVTPKAEVKVEAKATTSNKAKVDSKPVDSKAKVDSKVKTEAKAEVKADAKATPAKEVAKEDAEPQEPVEETLKTKYTKLSGPKIAGEKIDLSQFNKPKKKKEDPKKDDNANKRKRRRISKPGDNNNRSNLKKDNKIDILNTNVTNDLFIDKKIKSLFSKNTLFFNS